MKNNQLIVAFLLTLCLLFTSCDKDVPASATVDTTVEIPETTVQTEETYDDGVIDRSVIFDGKYNYIVVRSEDSINSVTKAAAAVYSKLGELAGSRTSIVTDWVKGANGDTVIENDEYEILVGATNRKESREALNNLPKDKFIISSVGNKIVILGCDDTATVDAVNYFIDNVLEYKDGKITVKLTSDILQNRVTPAIKLSEEADAELNGLELVSDVKTELATGITYHEMRYTDKKGAPVRAYVAEVAPGAGMFYTGTPGDGTELENKSGTVSSEMRAAVANGKNVIIGTNADFFAMGGNNLPSGLCVKEGQVLRENTSRAFFAVMKDGQTKILPSANYNSYAGKIQTAVGGRQIMLKDGKINDLALGDEFGYTRHPRTAVGIRADGTVILMVVDGRQPSISNGASLADLALMFLNMGCVDAINLDGGGSSTFVIRDTVKDTYKVMNSPSDGSERKIADSLLILLPNN